MGDRHDLALAGLERLARALPVDRPVEISVLGLHEALSASMLRLLRSRQRGVWGDAVIGRLGHRIFALSEEELRNDLLRSDLVMVPEGIRLPPNPLPSQLQLHEERARLADLLVIPEWGWERRPELDFALEEGVVRIWSRF